MANKTNASAEIKKTAAPAAEEVKKEAEVKVAAPAAEAPKTEAAPKKAEESKSAEKAAEKTAAAKKPAAKKPAEKAAAKKPAEKPAAKKTAEKAAAKKPAKKTAEKPAKKAMALTYDGIVELAQKKFKAANITGIKYPIAVNIELSGACEGVFYVYMDEAKIAVEPYLYNDYDVYVRADAETFAKVLEGKMNIYDALSTSDVKIDGLVKKAVLFVHAAF